MRRGWEGEARNWAAHPRTAGHDRAHEIFNLPVLLELLPPAGRCTLDLACGEGRISRMLRSRGHRVVGIDTSPTMVGLTAGQGSLVVAGDAARLPFANSVFDLVVAYMCLHDIDDMAGAVAEVPRFCGLRAGCAWPSRIRSRPPAPSGSASPARPS